LATVSGLRTSAEVPDNPSPPIAMVNFDSIEYHSAFNNALNTLQFTISVIVGRAAEREAQRKLDAYVSPTGSQSVKAGVESDRTLSGECQDLICTGVNSIGSIVINDQTYLACEFQVTVYA
jgi:hypothetical protein